VPIVQLRNRVEILRDMVARVVARSDLVGLTRNSSVFHVLAAAANEDAEQYFQLSRMRTLFSIDSATGSDLDERAAEVQPATIVRRAQLAASGNVVFSRPGVVGEVTIPTGSIVAASDADGQIKFRTTSPSAITAGNTDSPAVNVVAVEPGIRGNVPASPTTGSINQFVSRIPGATTVANAAAFSNGRDRESDANFRARIKAFIQALSRGTPTALEGFAKNVILTDGRRVLFSKVVEPIVPDGTVVLYIDDGTGGIEEFSSEFISSPDTVVISALGGETVFFTTQKPIRDDGSFVLKINGVTQQRSTDFPAAPDYYLNPTNGKIELAETAYPTGLTALDTVTAEYRYYTGLIQETQRVIDGDPATPLTRPGVRAAGRIVYVRPPSVVFQSVTAQISVRSEFDTTAVGVEVAAAIQDYINSLDIGDDVILSEIIERSMAVEGMFDITVSVPTTNQVLLENQVARITSAGISLT
jgi:uncharacterized phage protein gp47/JayE